MNKEFDIYEKEKRPVIALRGMWVEPDTVIHFDVGRDKSLDAIEKALKEDSIIVTFTQKDLRIDNPQVDDLYDVGSVVMIKQILKLENGITRILVDGICRCKAIKIYDGKYFTADIKEYYYNEKQDVDKEILALMSIVNKTFEEYAYVKKYMDLLNISNVTLVKNPEKFVNLISSYVKLSDEDNFDLFSIFDIKERLLKLNELMLNEIEITKLENDISKKVSLKVNKGQKEYYLREQLNVIKEELSEKYGQDEENESEQYYLKIYKLDLDKESEDMLLKEVEKLSEIPASSPEGNVIRSYLDKVIALPWNKMKKEKLDVKYTRKILDKEHYGLEDVKDRIVESIALRIISKNQKGSIICLVGPPGVGKTSIAKSIAKSLNREFVSMRLGGVHDESEIRGHRRTYVGAMPGKILTLLERCKVKNPVMLLDEIDKVSNDFNGDPSSALLEVLDPEQNNKFLDNYINIAFDLSKVMFITTANTVSTIPPALLDRMEIIPVSSYTYEEKEKIALNYLIPKIFKTFSITKKMLDIKKDAVKDMINYYTREAGVRNLERLIEKIIRKAATILVTENSTSKINVNSKNLSDFLGKRKFLDDQIEKVDMVGVVNGLAWTEVGGELLTIETDVVKGTGKIQLTGQLGDVMKESAMTAISFVRSKADKFKIKDDFYKEKDIHIHVPEGAVPKDGPSAGITMTCAIVSALTNRKVNHNFAMTGEVTLRGRVLAIGGLKEKVLAANRYGIKNIVIPKENERDIDEIPKEIRETLKFYPITNVMEVLDLVLEKEV